MRGWAEERLVVGMANAANSRWQLRELPGRQLVLVKDFTHHITHPPFLGKLAVVIRSNGISFHRVPASERWPPDSQELLFIVPAQSVDINNLQDVFSDAIAAEIFHVYRQNRRYLIQLVVNNTIPLSDSGDDEPEMPTKYPTDIDAQ
jgi:hypothetical protein